MIRLSLILALMVSAADAETLVAARTLPAQTIIGPEDLLSRDIVVPGAVEDPGELIGMETRVALYAGRPIRPGDVGLPAIVERNQIVVMVYTAGGIHITTEGRALARAGPGDLIRVMNLSSRNTITARIGIDGAAYVSP